VLVPGRHRSAHRPQAFLIDQGITGDTEQGQLAPAGRRLDLSQLENVVRAQQLLPDPQDACLKVDIVPAQAQDLTARRRPYTSSRTKAGYSGSGRAAAGNRLASSADHGWLRAGGAGGTVASLATLRWISSSRIARVSAAPRTVRMTCTLAAESPACSLPLK
jgi:hypothetical protein